MTQSQHIKILISTLLLVAASFAATANNLPCTVNISQYPPRPAKSSAQPYKYSGNELTENSFSVNHRLRQRMSRDAGKASRRSWIAVGKSQADGGNYDTDNGLNLYDFHARQHDPFAPHFTTIDPLAEVNQGFSPYVFCGGNPINYIDPDGKRDWPVGLTYNGGNRKHENNYNAPRENGRLHKGIDINIGSGNDDLGAPVFATHDGIVTRVIYYTDDNNSGGTRIQITSENGKISTYYMHLNSISDGLDVGTKVIEHQQIGTVGGSGKHRSLYHRVHLHYELRIDNKQIDPTNGKENLKDPQKLLGINTDNRAYKGAALDEVVVYGEIKQKPIQINLIPINVQIEVKEKIKY